MYELFCSFFLSISEILFVVEDIGRGLADVATAANFTKPVLKTFRRIIELSCSEIHLFSPLYSDFLQVLLRKFFLFLGLIIPFLNF
jgi:hypothetical protein